MVTTIANIPTSWNDVWDDIESQVAVGSRGIGSFDLNYQVRSNGSMDGCHSARSADISPLSTRISSLSSPTPSIFGGGNGDLREGSDRTSQQRWQSQHRRTKFDVKWKNGGAGLMDLMSGSPPRWLTRIKRFTIGIPPPRERDGVETRQSQDLPTSDGRHGSDGST